MPSTLGAKKTAGASSVLLIEPVLRVRSCMEASLIQGGYRVVSSADAGSAMRLLGRERPDVVILSCAANAKGLEGFTLCAIMVQHQLAPVVMMTSPKPTKEQVLRAVRAGAKEFMISPTMGHALYAKIERAFSQTQVSEIRSRFPIIHFGDRELTTAQKVDIIAREASSLRALPHAVTRILQTMGTDASGASDVTRAALSDPTIAAMILKRANSSYYGGGKAITELRTAVVRLGLKECRDLVVGLSVFNLFSADDSSFGFNRIWYWLHSVACGVITQRIAQQCPMANKEDAFTVGLLHDIGKIILDDFLNPQYREVVRLASTKGLALYDAEQRLLERTHVFVGRRVAEQWKFSENVCNALGSHHDISLIMAERPTLSGALYLANQMAKALLVGQGGDYLVLDIPAATWRMYGFGENIGPAFLDEIYRELRDVCGFLQIQDHQIDGALERRTATGRAVIIDERQEGSWLLSLFLVNQGFEVQRTSSLQEAEGLEDWDVLLYSAQNADQVRSTVQRCEETGRRGPLVCLAHADESLTDFAASRAWLRVVPLPLDCFVLFCAIRELLPQRMTAEAEEREAAPTGAVLG